MPYFADEGRRVEIQALHQLTIDAPLRYTLWRMAPFDFSLALGLASVCISNLIAALQMSHAFDDTTKN